MKVRDSDGPDQAIDLDRPTYEEIHEKISKMLYSDGFNLKPIDELKSVIPKLRALNVKGLQIEKLNLQEGLPDCSLQSAFNFGRVRSNLWSGGGLKNSNRSRFSMMIYCFRERFIFV